MLIERDGEGRYLWHHSVQVDIIANDTRVIAPQLQGHSLDGLCAASHHPLSCLRRSSEADLANTGVLSTPRPKGVITTQSLHNTSREKLGGQLCQFQVTVRSERRRLDNNSVSGVHSGRDLAQCQQYGEVPWHNSTGHADGGVSLDNSSLFGILDDVLGDLKVGDLPHPLDAKANLHARLGERLALLHGQNSGQGILVLLNGVRVGMESSTALLECSLGPFLKGLLGGVDSTVQVLAGCDRHRGIGLSGRRVDPVADFSCRGQLIVNDIAEGL